MHELGAELSAALYGLLPHEGFSLIAFDPVSGLRTFATERNMLKGGLEARLVHNETVQHDLHRFADLARRPNPVGTLGGGWPGEDRSPRLHELLAEQGFGRSAAPCHRGACRDTMRAGRWRAPLGPRAGLSPPPLAGSRP